MGEGLISIRDEYVIELIRTVMYYCTRESEIGNNIIDRWYSKKGVLNRIKKALSHKITETKIEEIINEGIENKKEKEVVVKIKKLMTDQYIKKLKSNKLTF